MSVGARALFIVVVGRQRVHEAEVAALVGRVRRSAAMVRHAPRETEAPGLVAVPLGVIASGPLTMPGR